MTTQTNQIVSKQFKVAAVVLFTAISSTLSAQSARTEVEIVQEAFGLEKKVAISNFMDLGEDAGSFWVIYDEYEAKRKKLGNERIEVIKEYAANYPDISDEKILELFKKTNQVKKSFAKLQQTYFNKMKKEVGVSKAAQFWQLENYFNAMIQSKIYSQIPFIGENIDGN